MGILTKIRYFFKNLRNIKWVHGHFEIKTYNDNYVSLSKHHKTHIERKNNYKLEDEVAKAMANTISDDNRAIEKITIRLLHNYEKEYVTKILNSLNLQITKANYKNYSFGSTKYKNKIYSAISLYKMTVGRRKDYKYILIYQHTKNNKNTAKLRLKYKLMADFTDIPYHGSFNRLLKNNTYKEKIWKKVYKLCDEEEYFKNKNIAKIEKT